MFLIVSIAALTAVAAVVLLILERTCWRRAAAQLAPGRLSDTIGRWILMAVCVTGAVALCGVAMALNVTQPVWRTGAGTLILVVDVSRSMYAQDIQPSRLEAAKALLGEGLHHFADWQLAVVAFAGDASVTCPLTLDHDAARSAISLLDEDATSTAGTSIGSALAEALEAVRDEPRNAAVLLVSDGENLDGSVDAAISRARALGVPVHVLAVGTAEGALVPPGSSAATGTQRQPETRAQMTRLDEVLLRRLTDETGGRYISASTNGAVNPDGLVDLASVPGVLSGDAQRAPREDAARYLVLLALVLLSAATLLSPVRT